eukprot:gb/GFBE01034204.1/.p1 GENE.gb/GFBE01034204.1/~~gb/GFBE01034204.1/.p1  ORF type:complete len:359 (+),score=144.64 gb/GFBE01034204.1/:1-1077(+)
MAGLPPMTQTEEKLRGMGVTMDQRRRLMMASKFGLGPLGQMGIGDKGKDGKDGRSRSPPLPGQRALPPPTVSSSSTDEKQVVQATQVILNADQAAPGAGKLAAAPGGHLVPAQTAEMAKKRQAEQAARAQAISRGGMAVKAMASAVVSAREDAEDLDSFLAGGRKMAVQFSKVMDEKKKKMVIEQASQENLQKSAEGAKQAEAERLAQEQKEAEDQRRREEEKKKREEARLKKEEEDRKQEERRRRKEEEKKRKREEKERKEQEGAEGGEADGSGDEESRNKEGAGAAGVFKAVMKGDENKRMHWGDTVKGKVSYDYKGMSDVELERRFAASQASGSGEKLMTEQEVLAMLKKGKSKK